MTRAPYYATGLAASAETRPFVVSISTKCDEPAVKVDVPSRFHWAPGAALPGSPVTVLRPPVSLFS